MHHHHALYTSKGLAAWPGVHVPAVVEDDHVVRAGTVIPVGEQGSKGSHGHLLRVPLHACHEARLSNGGLQSTWLFSERCINAT